MSVVTMVSDGGIRVMRTPLLLLLVATLAAAESWVGALPTMDTVNQDLDLALPGGGTAAVRVFFPAHGDGPWPVVIFSHGLAGSRTGYGFLAKRWSAHGYVVVLPNHPGSDTDTFRGKPLSELTQNLKRATTDPAILAGRPKLVSQLIDALPALEQAVPALAGHVDRAKVGVGGHSYGAWTTMCVAGMRPRITAGAPVDLSDPRPIAFAALSPNGPSAISDPADWAGCTRPLLVMTGSDDRQPAFLNPPGEERSGAWRRKAFDFAPADGGKMLAWFEGSRHCTYSDGAGAMLSGEPRPDPAQVEAVAVTTLAWWDARLRGDARAKAWLEDPAAPASLGAWARFERR